MSSCPQVHVIRGHSRADFTGSHFVLEDREYTVSKPFATGGTSRVFVAEPVDTRTSICKHGPRPLAVKLLKASSDSDDVATERFMRECELVCNLHHPLISQGYAQGQWNQHPCLIMEMIPGISLARLLKMRNKLPLSSVLNIVQAILVALNYLHLDGRVIAHRDIKPANILYLRDGTAKLIDFGTARTEIRIQHELVTDRIGSLPYIAPEQIEDPSSADIRSDIYALGSVFFELYSGFRAFQSKTQEGIIRSKQSGRTPFVSHIKEMSTHREIAATCNKILNSSMAKDPDDRYENPSRFLGDIRLVRELWNKANRGQPIEPLREQAGKERTDTMPQTLPDSPVLIHTDGSPGLIQTNGGQKPIHTDDDGVDLAYSQASVIS